MNIRKKVLQFIIIMVFFLIGQMISSLIKSVIVIPGSIVGMLLLFVSLLTGAVKIDHVEETGQFFLKYMGFFFIPLGVSLIESYQLIQAVWWQITVILILTNIIVMGVTAKVTEYMIHKKGEA